NMTVRFRRRATQDIEDIYERIAQESLVSARRTPFISAGCVVRRQNLSGREPRGYAGGATNQNRTGGKYLDSQNTRADRSAHATRPCRRGDRVEQLCCGA